MTSLEKKNKRKGIIGTILFHALLLVAFLFMGLTYQDPPPSEEGISIKFGFSDEGLGKIEPEDTEEVTEIVEEEIIEEQIESTEEIVTQSEIEAPVVENTEEKEDPKEEVTEEKELEVNNKALYTGKKKTTVTFEGRNDNDDLGYVGKGGEGEGEGEGEGTELGNRNPIFLPEPIYDSEEEGKVIVHIIVDKSGNVISAITDIGTTLNKQLLAEAKEAALKTKYPPKADAPNQHGKLIYTFQKN